MQLEGIDHVALSVRDVELSAKWYIDVLGFERKHEGMWNGIPTFIAKGTTAIALFPTRNHDSKKTPTRAAEISGLSLFFELDFFAEGVFQSPLDQVDREIGDVDPDPLSSELLCRVNGCAASAKRIEDNIAKIRRCADDTFE